MMEIASEAATARVITLMTPAEKSRLESKARKANISIGEFVRRSVEAYDPNEIEQLEQLANLARAFRESAERASAAVDRANAQVQATLDHFSKRRGA
ncbi:hypothetical protein KEU06_06455 [Pseudaminobacter sp. 19-2017]|uniref:Ribbon-helix-helix protein, CopG family n=1 Tax=Pseudaminobacter soli (ex Zhang et al. 2022) TaxID=2831468 RepID=A0A942DZJ3_9HYPH|nr:hypothetical protein [Pseudaminobacter soli]MBS3648266.1 hypothetical protein [Pseudaminobacter soli]